MAAWLLLIFCFIMIIFPEASSVIRYPRSRKTSGHSEGRWLLPWGLGHGSSPGGGRAGPGSRALSHCPSPEAPPGCQPVGLWGAGDWHRCGIAGTGTDGPEGLKRGPGQVGVGPRSWAWTARAVSSLRDKTKKSYFC